MRTRQSGEEGGDGGRSKKTMRAGREVGGIEIHGRGLDHGRRGESRMEEESMGGSGIGSRDQSPDHDQNRLLNHYDLVPTDTPTAAVLHVRGAKRPLHHGTSIGKQELPPQPRPPQIRSKKSSAHNLSLPTTPFLAAAELSNRRLPVSRLAFERATIPRLMFARRKKKKGMAMMIGIVRWAL